MINVAIGLGTAAFAGLVALAVMGFEAAIGLLLVTCLFLVLLAFGAASRRR